MIELEGDIDIEIMLDGELGIEIPVVGEDVPVYSGAYSAIPTQEQQEFATAGKMMRDHFIVEPIPQNYGLITYNGFELTVS